MISRQICTKLQQPANNPNEDSEENSSPLLQPLVNQVVLVNFPESLIGDERRFKQVLINLVKNALKFTKGGRITIKMHYADIDEMLIVHVEDTGVGISRLDLPKLFTRFGKLQRTATLNNEGIGLGLNIVRNIVELCEGQVSAHS